MSSHFPINFKTRSDDHKAFRFVSELHKQPFVYFVVSLFDAP